MLETFALLAVFPLSAEGAAVATDELDVLEATVTLADETTDKLCTSSAELAPVTVAVDRCELVFAVVVAARAVVVEAPFFRTGFNTAAPAILVPRIRHRAILDHDRGTIVTVLATAVPSLGV